MSRVDEGRVHLLFKRHREWRLVFPNVRMGSPFDPLSLSGEVEESARETFRGGSVFGCDYLGGLISMKRSATDRAPYCWMFTLHHVRGTWGEPKERRFDYEGDEWLYLTKPELESQADGKQVYEWPNGDVDRVLERLLPSKWASLRHWQADPEPSEHASGQQRPAPPVGVGGNIEEPFGRTAPIFLVHGRDDAVRHEVVRVVERLTERSVVVLHEQANSGRTILEKFEHHATSAVYAVVLLTGDDEGRVLGDPEYRKRGRQNVILELGFFFGKLGRKRVSVRLSTEVERPSDIEGLVYIVIDAAGGWKQQLARELAAAGIDVDYGRMP